MTQVRIFVAEDSATVRTVLRHTLSASPLFEVVGEAGDGNEALQAILKVSPDVALVDIGLPGMDGLALTKELKSRLQAIRVIICTSSFEESVIFSAFAAGADGYILKGRPAETFVNAVKSVADGVGWLDPAIASTVLRASASMAGTVLARSAKHAPPAVPVVQGAAPASTNVGQLQRGKERSAAFVTAVEAHSPVSVLMLLGAKYQAENDDVRTEALYHGALALAEKLHGPKDLDVAVIASQLADFYYERDKYPKAEPLYLKALEIRHAALGDAHAEVAKSLEDLGNLYDTEGEYANAERYYLWALSIRQNVGSPRMTAETTAKIAWIYRAQGKHELAEKLECRAKAATE